MSFRSPLQPEMNPQPPQNLLPHAQMSDLKPKKKSSKRMTLKRELFLRSRRLNPLILPKNSPKARRALKFFQNKLFLRHKNNHSRWDFCERCWAVFEKRRYPKPVHQPENDLDFSWKEFKLSNLQNLRDFWTWMSKERGYKLQEDELMIPLINPSVCLPVPVEGPEDEPSSKDHWDITEDK